MKMYSFSHPHVFYNLLSLFSVEHKKCFEILRNETLVWITRWIIKTFLAALRSSLTSHWIPTHYRCQCWSVLKNKVLTKIVLTFLNCCFFGCKLYFEEIIFLRENSFLREQKLLTSL